MRKNISFNENWLFSNERPAEVVTLPHPWNAVDGQDGGNDYYRGTCTYTKTFVKPKMRAGDEVWAEFLGAAHTCDVALNGVEL